MNNFAQTIRAMRATFSRKTLTAVSYFDSHYPKLHRPTWRACLDFCKRNRVGIFVLGGDNLDCGAISHHTKGKPKLRPTGQMKADLDGFRKEMLDAIDPLLPSSCIKVWLTGNHEAWLEQMLEEQPELDGLIDFPKYLELEKRGWLVKPQGGHFKYGKLKWIHGDVVSGSGINAVRNALNTYVENIVMGHGHGAYSATKTLPHSSREKWQAWMLGTGGDRDAGYLKNKPTGWLNQLGITEFHGPRGLFNMFPVTVFGGRFAYGGTVYGK